MSNDNEFSSNYPPWLYFFPMYIILFTYALLGRIGYIIVADEWVIFSPAEIVLYYVLTYGVYFPVIFLSQWLFYRMLSKRSGIYWRDFSRLDKILIISYDIAGFILFIWCQMIFGVNAPYNTTWDFTIGWMYVWWGDIVFFFIAGPLFLISYHGINFASCHQKKDRRQYQFFLVVVGTAVLGTITQDWFWWISAPNPPWGPGVVIYYYFPDWIQVPFTKLYAPVVYLVVAIISLLILFFSTIKLYSLKQYIFWCVCPYLLLVLIGNVLFYVF
jgi:hypothetical protein